MVVARGHPAPEQLMAEWCPPPTHRLTAMQATRLVGLRQMVHRDIDQTVTAVATEEAAVAGPEMLGPAVAATVAAGVDMARAVEVSTARTTCTTASPDHSGLLLPLGLKRRRMETERHAVRRQLVRHVVRLMVHRVGCPVHSAQLLPLDLLLSII